MQTSLSDAEFTQFRAFASGAEILHKEIALTVAEILALYTTPKELVAVPGTKYVHEFLSAVLILDWVTPDYTTNGDLTINETDGSGTTLSDTVAKADFVQASGDKMRTMQVLSATAAVLLPGKSLALCCASGNPAAGNSVIRVKLTYRTHPTGL